MSLVLSQGAFSIYTFAHRWWKTNGSVSTNIFCHACLEQPPGPCPYPLFFQAPLTLPNTYPHYSRRELFCYVLQRMGGGKAGGGGLCSRSESRQIKTPNFPRLGPVLGKSGTQTFEYYFWCAKTVCSWVHKDIKLRGNLMGGLKGGLMMP